MKKELKLKEDEEELHLEKLRKAMQNTQESFHPKKIDQERTISN